MQNRKFPALVLSVLMAGVFVGCDDDTVSEKKSVDVKDDGTKVTKTEETKVKDDGTVVTEKSKDVDKPADVDHDKDGVKAKVEVEKKD